MRRVCLLAARLPVEAYAMRTRCHQVHVEEGALICPESGHRFVIRHVRARHAHACGASAKFGCDAAPPLQRRNTEHAAGRGRGRGPVTAACSAERDLRRGCGDGNRQKVHHAVFEQAAAAAHSRVHERLIDHPFFRAEQRRRSARRIVLVVLHVREVCAGQGGVSACGGARAFALCRAPLAKSTAAA